MVLVARMQAYIHLCQAAKDIQPGSAWRGGVYPRLGRAPPARDAQTGALANYPGEDSC
jgi:hypothetical protein